MSSFQTDSKVRKLLQNYSSRNFMICFYDTNDFNDSVQIVSASGFQLANGSILTYDIIINQFKMRCQWHATIFYKKRFVWTIWAVILLEQWGGLTTIIQHNWIETTIAADRTRPIQLAKQSQSTKILNTNKLGWPQETAEEEEEEREMSTMCVSSISTTDTRADVKDVVFNDRT